MKHTEMITVIQAHSEGKSIECTHKTGDDWSTVESPEFNFMDCDYRVKPEPVYTVLGMSDIGVIVFGVDIRDSDKKYVEIKALEDALFVINCMNADPELKKEDVKCYAQLQELIK